MAEEPSGFELICFPDAWMHWNWGEQWMVTIRAAIPDIKPAEHTNEWTAERLQKKKLERTNQSRDLNPICNVVARSEEGLWIAS